jgi:hypothetical protein
MVASEKNLRELVLELVKLKERLTVLDSLEDSTLYIQARDRLEEIVDDVAKIVLVGEGAE